VHQSDIPWSGGGSGHLAACRVVIWPRRRPRAGYRPERRARGM